MIKQHHIYNGGANRHVVTVFEIDRHTTHTQHNARQSKPAERASNNIDMSGLPSTRVVLKQGAPSVLWNN